MINWTCPGCKQTNEQGHSQNCSRPNYPFEHGKLIAGFTEIAPEHVKLWEEFSNPGLGIPHVEIQSLDEPRIFPDTFLHDVLSDPLVIEKPSRCYKAVAFSADNTVPLWVLKKVIDLLPADAELIHAFSDIATYRYALVFSSSEFVDVPIGMIIPFINVVVNFETKEVVLEKENL